MPSIRVSEKPRGARVRRPCRCAFLAVCLTLSFGLIVAASTAAAGLSATDGCVVAIGKGAKKAVQAQAKQASYCVKSVSRQVAGQYQTMQRCLGEDASGKLARARAKLARSEGEKCGSRPPFGYTGAFNAESAAVGGVVAAVRMLVGDDLNAAVYAQNDLWRCQSAIVRDAGKMLRLATVRFQKCLKLGLSSGSIESRAALVSCASEINMDAKGKWAKGLAGLSKHLTSKCGSANIPLALAGPCGSAGDFAACLDPLLACQSCRMLDTLHDAGLDCDALDDGSDNGSCPAAYPQTFENLLTMPVGGKTYYIDPSCGDDANTGYSADCAAPNNQGPWSSFAPLGSVGLQPGDAALLRAGTYGQQKQALNLAVDGTATQPIRFAAYQGETAVIDGEWGNSPDVPLEPGDQTPVLRLGGAYNVIDGITISGCNMGCIQIKEGAENTILRGVTVVGGGEDGIKATMTRNVLVTASEFRGFHNEAIDIWHSANMWVVGNSFHDNETSLRSPGSTVWAKAGSTNVHYDANLFRDLVVAEHALMLGGCCWANWSDLGGLIDVGGSIVPQPVAFQAYAIGNTFENISISLPDRNDYSSTLSITGCHHCEASGNTIRGTHDALAVHSTKASNQPCRPGVPCDPVNDPASCCNWEVLPLDVSVRDNVVRGVTPTDPENSGNPSTRLVNLLAEHDGRGIVVDSNTYCADPPTTCRIGPAWAAPISFAQWQAAGFDLASTLSTEAQCPLP